MVFRFPYKAVFNFEIPGLPLPISRLFKTLAILMYLAHLDACIFWALEMFCPEGSRWIDKSDLIYVSTKSAEDLKSHLYERATKQLVPLSRQYLVSYLYAIRALVLKLRETYLDAENAFAVCEFVVGILSYGTVFGNIHSIVEMLDHDAQSQQAEEVQKYKMQWMRQYMISKNLPVNLQMAVLEHREIQWNLSKGRDENRLFDEFPKSIVQELKRTLYLDLIKKVPLFKEEDDAFHNSLLMKIQPLIVLDGWFVFKKRDEGNEMFFIRHGKADIVTEEGTVLLSVTSGSFFGEIALFEGRYPSSSCHLITLQIVNERQVSRQTEISIFVCLRKVISWRLWRIIRLLHSRSEIPFECVRKKSQGQSRKTKQGRRKNPQPPDAEQTVLSKCS